MLSYWEDQSFTRYDFIVIGAGIVGVSTAIELKQKFPAAAVLILERGLLPTGATTRNAGFACMGSATELLDDLKTRDEQAVVHLFAQRKTGLDKLRARFGDAAIGFKADGGHELIVGATDTVFEKLDYLNELLEPVLGRKAFEEHNAGIRNFGFSATHVKGLIRNHCEGGLDSGLLMRALLKMAGQLGIMLMTGADVTHFEEDEKGVHVAVRSPYRTEALPLLAGRLIICTNAFTGKLLPEAAVIPGRGQALITEPVTDLKVKGVFHFDAGYYYFRELDGRVLFGGGRNLDIAGETTTDIALNEQIQQDLEEKLATVILPDTPFKIARRWAGIMGFGQHKGPVVRAFSEKVYGAFRMGGMGVALGTEVAEQVVGLICD